jgi:arylsulfatase A-like enzyme
MATAAALAEATPPNSIHSVSFLPAILGEPERQRRHDYLYWEFYARGSSQAVRMRNWKAIRQPMVTGEIELYDLSTDVGEQHDIAARHPDIVEQVRAVMAEAHRPSPLFEVPGN